jgi:CDP-diacylglycerol---serine O-phosphatidyltransferase
MNYQPLTSMKNIPNFFTLLNLVFGCMAVIFILQNGITIMVDENGQQFIDIPEKIWLASLFIGLAAVVDFADGFVARIMKAGSALGAQLDSLADLVSFGVAPGMIMYQFLRLSFADSKSGVDTSIIMLLPALLLPCAAAWRLAKFSLDKSQENVFRGLPVPSVGIFIGSLPLVYWNVNEPWALSLLHNHWFLYGVILLFTILMVSSIPMLSLKFKNFSLKDNWEKYLLAAISLVCILILQWLSPAVIIIAYILLSLLISRKIHPGDQSPSR